MLLVVASGLIAAVIFDMDGVLTDSEPFYHQAINEVLAGHGLFLTEEENRAVLGATVEGTWRWLMDRFQLHGPLEQWLAEYDQTVLRILKAQVQPAPGLSALLAGLKRRWLRLALASSSQRNWVEAVLAKLGLEQTFEVVLAGGEVTKGKPDPEIYLTTARRLGLPPERCLVVEDSPVGIEAAHRAGMRVVAVRTPYTRGLDLSRADRVIDSLAHFDWGMLL